jgi:Fic family protein
MKVPKRPPNFEELLKKITELDPEKLTKILSGLLSPIDQKGRYLHWDKLQYLESPEGMPNEEWWFRQKMARRSKYKILPFKGKKQKEFVYCPLDSIYKILHEIDQQAAGNITIQDTSSIIDEKTRNRYIVNSLIEEAINSSQLEGAATTRVKAIEMIRNERKARDESEQMILNNFHTMQFIKTIKKEKLTEKIILKLQSMLTEGTFDKPEKVGRFRREDEDVNVEDQYGEVLHYPPDAGLIPEYISQICHFANYVDSEVFVHPVLKGVILHFMLAYVHPFVDGNGRTARALFYWYMLRQGYWLMEMISISEIIKQAPVKYGKAFLHTETDDNDLTYFILHQLNVIKKALEKIYEYIRDKHEEKENFKLTFSLIEILNERQQLLLQHAFQNKDAVYLIKAHQKTHQIVYETARQDLIQLSDSHHLLEKKKKGKGFVFVVPKDLKQRLKAFK